MQKSIPKQFLVTKLSIGPSESMKVRVFTEATWKKREASNEVNQVRTEKRPERAKAASQAMRKAMNNWMWDSVIQTPKKPEMLKPSPLKTLHVLMKRTDWLINLIWSICLISFCLIDLDFGFYIKKIKNWPEKIFSRKLKKTWPAERTKRANPKRFLKTDKRPNSRW